MYNSFVTRYRRKTKFETQYDPEPYLEAQKVEARQEAQVQVKEVEAALGTVPAKYRDILVKVCFEGMPYKAVAKQLDMPIGTVRSRLARARAQLQEALMTPQSNVIPLVNVAKNSPVPKATGGMLTGTNTDNQYLHNESGSIRHAEERRNKYVNQNKFMANPEPQPTAPIPTKIYTRTNLLDQAGEDSNPLSILDGNPFVAPQQRFLPQVNEEFAPRPEFTAFTTSPFIGVHKTSPIAPNTENNVNQKKGVMDWMQEIKAHKYSIPIGIAGIIILFYFVFIRGRN